MSAHLRRPNDDLVDQMRVEKSRGGPVIDAAGALIGQVIVVRRIGSACSLAWRHYRLGRGGSRQDNDRAYGEYGGQQEAHWHPSNQHVPSLSLRLHSLGIN